ncbi:MAG: endonuclease III [Patescibacteria group bacterium]|nr:endonuclease III [Patescibacteria group bacterium]
MSTRGTENIIKTLASLYPNPKPTLNRNSPFECLIAVMLSAQCTDKTVNKVTSQLFPATPEKIHALGRAKLAEIIKPCGLFNSKSKNIYETAKLIKQVPDTLEELTALPGVGEKTAEVVLAQIFKKPAFPVDTHIHRIANRLGICKTKTPSQTSKCLKQKIPQKHWHDLHIQIIFHGRDTCQSRKPKCPQCKLRPYCGYIHKIS